MDARFLAQPFKAQSNAHEFITRALADPGIDSFLMLTAWVRRSGARLLVDGLDALHARGGHSEALIGIDLTGTSRQGLEESRRIFNHVEVIHDIEGRTFHPKVYVARGAARAHLLVGSNNVTAGGMFFNYEAALACTLNLSAARDRRILGDIDAYVADLRADSGVCRRLTAATLLKLRRGRYLDNEDASSARRSSEDRTRTSPASTTLFARSQFAKREAPPRWAQGSRQAGRRKSKGGRPTRALRAADLKPDTWWKQLQAGEAQQLARGHATGVIRVTRPPGLDMDGGDYFRRHLFDSVRWRRARDNNGNLLRLAEVGFDVVIDRRRVGSTTLTLDFGEHRRERGRATMLIHLGPLAALLREGNYEDWYLVIERTSASTHDLRVTRRQPI